MLKLESKMMLTKNETQVAECVSLLQSRGISINYQCTARSNGIGGLCQQKDILEESNSKFVRTPGSESKLDSLLDSLQRSRVVLVEGPPGCSKTTLVDMVTSTVGGAEGCITIFMGEQVDSKVLLGTFVCTGAPGEFMWRPGVLAKAVMDGKWIVVEDIDRAPPDVVSVLIPLVKYGTLQLPGYNEPLRTKDSFRLIATRRLTSDGRVLIPSSKLFETLEQKMLRVQFPAMNVDDLLQIVQVGFPDLASFLPNLIKLTTTPGIGLDPRLFLKLCARIAPMVQHDRIQSIEDAVSECIDVCFGLEAAKKKESHSSLITEVFQNISEQTVLHLCSSHKPVLQVSEISLSVGRASLPCKVAAAGNTRMPGSVKYAHTQSSLSLLEKIARSVQMREPVLLVGETGVGKTAAVNYLARATGRDLVAVNMSQQSDSSDLLGGFKPVDMVHLITPLREEFEYLFRRTFTVKQNTEFLGHVQSCYVKKLWRQLLWTIKFSAGKALKSVGKSSLYRQRWSDLMGKVKRLHKQLASRAGTMAFAFVEGSLVKAMRTGQWILLDEVNLATPETLQCLSSLLEGPEGTFLLIDRGDSSPVERHEDFRVFSCMNPATDHGKAPLPPHIRNRMTEFYVDEMAAFEDLRHLVMSYFPGLDLPSATVEGIIKFYREVRTLAENRLADGTGRKPHYSLRTLCRGLLFAGNIHHTNTTRALYEGLCMSFISQVTREQHGIVRKLCQTSLKVPSAVLSAPLPRPSGCHCVQVEGYWLRVGQLECHVAEEYILTPSVRANLRNLARIVSGSHFPVLLQGPTSAGKTSLIRWLADATGHRCVRINNHEHTDIQEYIGMYTVDNAGALVFKEGVLVEAMREGHWVILDELNLAPTEVLEALNRLLDDNRELFITETQTLVKAHPHFRVFGTQNPPGAYGGRKFLSRAFRNRFIELHFDEIPPSELITILYRTSGVPESYAKKMVAVLQDLQRQRSSAVVFAGKCGLITLRDLFKWARRYAKSDCQTTFNDWEQTLAEDGYLILAGRARRSEDVKVIVDTLKSRFKRTVDPHNLFGWREGRGSITSEAILDKVTMTTSGTSSAFSHVVWTEEMRRMAVLVGRAVHFREPVLLVGETGCGKTTMCQLLCSLMEKTLHCINCHMFTEASDFLGGLRAARRTGDSKDETTDAKLFEWRDGALVRAMQEGCGLLIDEISLAEDAVLERLNSVLEEDRKVLVAERGTELGGAYEVVAQEGFLLFATMNPGGDYGKRELSPALRNRFTEVWCPTSATSAGLRLIADHNITAEVNPSGTPWGGMMTEFIAWLQQRQAACKLVVSTRDLVSWIHFFNKTVGCSVLSPRQAFHHGACMVFLDGIDSTSHSCSALRKAGVNRVRQILGENGSLEEASAAVKEESDEENRLKFGIHPFFIDKGTASTEGHLPYTLDASGPRSNAFRLLRALQISKPLLLEGPPGVGKTTLVSVMARLSGHPVTRICLSEQTDLTELFGSDLPEEGGGIVKFSWRDGPFLRALKEGHWIVLDEMNLASQAVLEGLNACLDHRSQVYIPVLDMTFAVCPQTRIFACQNPVLQGGGRKQLPKSFVNRFTKVYMEKLSSKDLKLIATSLYPSIEEAVVHRMIRFNKKMSEVVDREKTWEFNLRDILRWCELIESFPVCRRSCDQSCDQSCDPSETDSGWDPGRFLGLIYIHRFRKDHMIKSTLQLFSSHFPPELFPAPHIPGRSTFHLSSRGLTVSRSFFPLEMFGKSFNFGQDSLEWHTSQLPYMEALLTCVQMNWMALLVGGSNSGKSSLVRVLAQLTGHKVVEFPVNSSMDTTDLVGGYVQMNSSRHLMNLSAELRDIALECAVDAVKSVGSREGGEAPGAAVGTTLTQLCEVVDGIGHVQKAMMDSNPEDSPAELLMTCVSNLKEQLAHFKSSLSTSALLSTVVSDSRVSQVERELEEWSTSDEMQFEWVDSPLVTALRHGHWLVISNANFCSPSVLDRLNALLEPGGVLTVDERGSIDGDIPVVKPHADFRLFMTMDPKYGELSKAMRNRGVEIYIHKSKVKSEPLPPPPSPAALARSGRSCTLSADSWVLSPLATQARHHLLPVLGVLSEPGPLQLKNLSCQLDVFSDVCLRSDVEWREELLMLLSNEENLSIKAAVGSSLIYLRSLKAFVDASGLKEDNARQSFSDMVDWRCLPYATTSSSQNSSSGGVKELQSLPCSRAVFWKLASKAAQFLQSLSRSPSPTHSRSTLLQLSRAVREGSVSVVVLSHPDIAKVYPVLKSLGTVLRTLCEASPGCTSSGAIAEQASLFCSWLDVVIDMATATESSWLSFSVCWHLLWNDFLQLLASVGAMDGERSPSTAVMWRVMEDFGGRIAVSLSSCTLWLSLWSALKHCKLHHTQDEEVRAIGASPPQHTSPSDGYLQWILPAQLSAWQQDGVELIKAKWRLLTTQDPVLYESLLVNVRALRSSQTEGCPNSADDHLLSSSASQPSSPLLSSTASQPSSPLLSSTASQPSSPLLCCTVLLGLRRILLALMENDLSLICDQALALSSYLKSVDFPLDVKAAVGLLADIEDAGHFGSDQKQLITRLLQEAKSRVVSLGLNANQDHLSSGQPQQQMFTVARELSSLLSSSRETVTPAVHSGTYPHSSATQSGGNLQSLAASIGSVEATSSKLATLHGHMWEAAFNGSLSTRLHCSLESQIQLSLYRQTVGAVCSVLGKAIQDFPAESYQALLANLEMLPSHLATTSGLSLHFKTALELLSQSCVKLRSLSTVAVGDAAQVHSSAVPDQTVADVGAVSVYTGLSLAVLLAPTQEFNPFEVTWTESRVLQDLVDSLKMRLGAFQAHFDNISSAFPVEQCADMDLWTPLCIKEILANIDRISERLNQQDLVEISSLQSKGQEAKFLNLSRECQSLMTTLCDHHKVLALAVGLLDVGTPATVLAETRGWICSVLAALYNLEHQYVEFLDLILPWKLAILQVMEGILLLFLHKSSTCAANRKEAALLSDLMEVLHTGSVHPMQLTSTILQFAKVSQSGALKKTLMVSALERVSQHIQFLGACPSHWHSQLNNLISCLVALWRKAEDDKREREEQEAALFWYKEKTHTFTEETEASLSEKLFPSFEFDFETAEWDETGKVQMDTEPDSGSGDVPTANTGEEGVLFTSQEMATVFGSLAKIAGLGQAIDENMGTQQPFNATHTLYQCVFEAGKKRESLRPVLPFLSKNDEALMSAHLKELVFISSAHFGQSDHSEQLHGRSPPVDVYHDPLPKEFQSAKAVLDGLSTACDKFLAEWPDHPVLNKIVTSCRTVLLLPATSPLMKVLAALEYVLRQTQEWEMYASSQVSLSTEIAALTDLILKWRKMELSCWESLLETEDCRSVREACKWWFHIRDSLEGLQESKDDGASLQEVLQVIPSFVESSNIGDFSTRVSILRLCSSSVFDKAHSKVRSVLCNLADFYEQFLESVLAQKNRLRAPLEKEFKDHVSLLRWNDGNYWALKDAIRKNHLAVAHLIRKYKEVLLQPVRSLLSASSLPKMTLGDSNVLAMSLYTPHLNCSLEECPPHLPALSVPLGASGGGTAGGASVSVEVAHQQLRQHLFAVLGDETLREAMAFVKESLGDLSMQMKEISNQINLSEVSEEKKRSEGKLQLQVKKRSLTDLFKLLAASGLSFKKGGKEASLLASTFMNTPLVSCDSGTSHFDGDFVTLVSSANIDFYRVVAMVISLNAALLKPSKELSFGDLNRIEGLTGTLVALIKRQREQLACSMGSLSHLDSFLNTLLAGFQGSKGGSGGDKLLFLSGRSHRATIAEMVLVLEQCSEAVEEVGALTAVHPGEACGRVGRGVPGGRGLPVCAREEGKEVLREYSGKLQALMPELRQLVKDIDSSGSDQEMYSLEFTTDLSRAFRKQASLMESELATMMDSLFTPAPPSFGPFGCFSRLLTMLSDVCQHMQGLSIHGRNAIPDFDAEMGIAVVDVTKAILSGVQGLIKAHQALRKQPAQDDTEPDQTDDAVYFKTVFHSTLELTESLHSEKVVQAVKKLVGVLNTSSEKTTQSKGLFSLSSYFVTALACFLEGYNSFLLSSTRFLLAANHTTQCYFQHLLEMFSTVVEKGFGVPDLDQKAEDMEGGTELVDAEAGGFDEGEGMENVSKGKEDLKEQLENALADKDGEKDNQQTKPEDADDDGIEMDFDFDGGKIEDVGGQDDDNDDPEQNEEDDDKDEIEKMGDLGNDPGDILDKNIWDPQEDDESPELQELPDSNVEGTDTKEDPELVAKDQNELSAGEDKEQPNSPKDGEAEPLPDDWDMKDEEQEPMSEEEHNGGSEEVDNAAASTLEEEIPEEEGTEQTSEGEETKESETTQAEEEEDEADRERGSDVAQKIEEAADEENKEDAESRAVPPPDSTATEVPDNQVNDEDNNLPNTATVEMEMSSTNNDDQRQSESSQQQNSVDSLLEGVEAPNSAPMDSPRNQPQRKPKSSRKPFPERTPASTESVPRAKRLKLSNKQASSQPQPEENSADQKASKASLYAHVEDEQQPWDEQALDTALPGQEGMQPLVEEEEEKGEEEDDCDDVEEMDVEDAGEDKGAKDSTRRLASEIVVPQPEEDNEDHKSLGSEEDSESDLEGDEMGMETDEKRLSFYHFNPDNYQEGGHIGQKDSEEALKMIEESTLLLQSEEESRVDAVELWSQYEVLTSELSQSLYENIRITFEPTLATQFKGDFRSGKRLNIRRLIPFIASHYQNDRIWLRRSKPSKMNYQVLVAVDDSSSMAENKCRLTAFKSLAAISGALGKLEGVSFGIGRFGNGVDVLKKFGEFMSTEGGGFVLQNMTFQQKKTNFVKLLQHSTALLGEEQRLSLHQSRGGHNQLLIVLSDGRGVFMDGQQAIEKAVRELNEQGIFSVFIILDPLQKDSVLSIRIPIFQQGKDLTFMSYLEAFPFPYYIILKDIDSLPEVLGESLQQWFQLVNERTKGVM